MINSLVQVAAPIANTEAMIVTFAAVVALAGSFVAFIAYRGYRRNASQPMLFLAVGIAFLTVVPAVIEHELVHSSRRRTRRSYSLLRSPISSAFSRFFTP